MGAYINPPDISKEQWLAENATRIPDPNFFGPSRIWEKRPDGHLPVVLCFNAVFTAAGIAYSKNELEAFSDPADKRPKIYFYAPIEKLHKVSHDLARYLERQSP